MEVAWITGGGTGIGQALAFQMAERGYGLVLSGRRPQPLQETAAFISQRFPNCSVRYLSGDVAHPDHARQALQVAASLGPLTLLINNAGQNPTHRFDETSAQEFRDVFEVNCIGPILAVQAVLPLMKQAHRGTIVNVSSVLGKWSSAGSAAYSVSKYALTGLTDLLRQDLIDTGVHVLGVYPGFIRTAMTQPHVQPGSLREKVGVSAESMARAIVKAIDSKKAELHFPWYVSWVLRWHRWMPTLANRVARRQRG